MGRFNFQQIIHKPFLSYRRDGDMFFLLTDANLEVCEGEQCEMPYGQVPGKHFTVTDSMAL